MQGRFYVGAGAGVRDPQIHLLPPQILGGTVKILEVT